MAKQAEDPIKSGDLSSPSRIHFSAYEGCAESAERLNMPLAAAALRLMAHKARDAGGWLDKESKP